MKSSLKDNGVTPRAATGGGGHSTCSEAGVFGGWKGRSQAPAVPGPGGGSGSHCLGSPGPVEVKAAAGLRTGGWTAGEWAVWMSIHALGAGGLDT